MLRFRDREDAGAQLADLLHRRALADPIVLALTRGGVPVGAAVARQLGAPLEALVVRKLGAPSNPEYAIGALAEDGTVLVHEDVRGVSSPAWLEQVIDRERAEAERRVWIYRGNRPLPSVTGRCVVIVDDGMATGLTMAAAVESMRAHGAAHIVVAVPTASTSAVALLRGRADEVISCEVPTVFGAVGERYERFGQVADDEVVATLAPFTR